RRPGEPGPGLGHLVQRRPRGDARGEVQRVRARRPAVRPPTGAGAGGGPGAREDVPAPQAGVLRHGGGVRGAAAATRAGPDVADAPADTDREAHAPSNGSDVPVVTQRTRNVTLCFRLPPAVRPTRRPEAVGVVRSALCAPACTTASTLGCPVSSQSRDGDREFIRRGGEWWRLCIRHGWAGDRGITVCARLLGARALVGMPEATRLSVRRVATAGRAAPTTGILIRLGALSDKWSSGMGAFQ